LLDAAMQRIEQATEPGLPRLPSFVRTQYASYAMSDAFGPTPALDMRSTCAHAESMSRMVQIRNVPDTLHRKLKARALDAGQTLSDYLLAELERLAARPTREEMLARLHSRRRVITKTPAAVVIREQRESA
jgi:hypothetical protein